MYISFDSGSLWGPPIVDFIAQTTSGQGKDERDWLFFLKLSVNHKFPWFDILDGTRNHAKSETLTHKKISFSLQKHRLCGKQFFFLNLHAIWPNLEDTTGKSKTFVKYFAKRETSENCCKKQCIFCDLPPRCLQAFEIYCFSENLQMADHP